VLSKVEGTTAAFLAEFRRVVDEAAAKGLSAMPLKSVRIMKRQGRSVERGGGQGRPPHHHHHAGRGGGAPDGADMLDASSMADAARQRSFEEREEEYRQARARIFDGDTTQDVTPTYAPVVHPPSRPRPPMSHYGLFLADSHSSPWLPSVSPGPPGHAPSAAAHGWSTGQSAPFGGGGGGGGAGWGGGAAGPESAVFFMQQQQAQQRAMAGGGGAFQQQGGMMMMPPNAGTHWQLPAGHQGGGAPHPYAPQMYAQSFQPHGAYQHPASPGQLGGAGHLWSNAPVADARGMQMQPDGDTNGAGARPQEAPPQQQQQQQPSYPYDEE
jgi:hypothetical protein